MALQPKAVSGMRVPVQLGALGVVQDLMDIDRDAAVGLCGETLRIDSAKASSESDSADRVSVRDPVKY